MAAPIAAPAIAPAERVPLSDSFDDGELVKVGVGVHVEQRDVEVAASTDDDDSVERGASENTT
ncbi:hypothetical protein E4U58_001452, partial [Claviceps cyperi]